MKRTISLKWNAFSNFIWLGYSTGIGIAILPLYLQYLGAEAFGLVGFFTVLSSWMQLLDLGMSPLLSRQAAHARAHDSGFLDLKKLIRSLEMIVMIIAVIVFLAIYFSGDWIAKYWLQVASLATSDVATSIALMGAIIGFKFISSLYRSGIQGLENQVRLNLASIILITLKYVGALLVLHYITNDVVDFFIYQLIIGFVELIVIFIMFYSLLPGTEKVGIGIYWAVLKPRLPFAAGIAYTASIWVLLTQMDKMILSKVIPLAEYGYFALVVVVATGIIQVSGPISKAILPRMSYLVSQGNINDMLIIYRKSTQAMSVIMLPLVGVISLYSTELLYAWTGDMKAAEWAGPILLWFALGNGILAIAAFQYYLQFAYGRLRMHVIFNTISAGIQIPVIIYVAFTYGVLGVALAWFIIRLITFIVWTPIVHSKFAPGIHREWIYKDIAPVLTVTLMALFLINGLFHDIGPMSRLEIFAFLFCMVLVIMLLSAMFTSSGKKFLINMYKKVRT